MKEVVRRLSLVHLAVLALAAVAGGFLWAGPGSLSAVVGALCFSVPVLAFSGLVVRASSGDPKQFIGRFMAAEMLKWVSSGVFLSLAFLSTLCSPQPLLGGFFLSVLVQVFFPIFVRKESPS